MSDRLAWARDVGGVPLSASQSDWDEDGDKFLRKLAEVVHEGKFRSRRAELELEKETSRWMSFGRNIESDAVSKGSPSIADWLTERAQDASAEEPFVAASGSATGDSRLHEQPATAAFQDAIDRVAGIAYVGSDLDVGVTRLQAGLVAPCADRFVEGEMDPTRRLSVGRSFAPGSPPSLAEKLDRKLPRANEAALDKVRFSVHEALAAGYLAYAETEARGDVAFRPDRHVRDIWVVFAHSARGELEAMGIPREWIRKVHSTGATVLVGELRELGLTRWLGGSKLNQLGMLYAHAGVALRIVQTDTVPDEQWPEEVQLYQEVDRWPFDEYEISPSRAAT